MNEPRQLGALVPEWLQGQGEADLTITGLALDSRTVQPGELFFAYPGLTHDGRDYIAQALARGAAAVVYDPDGFQWQHAALGVPVPDLQQRLGAIAGRFFGHPSRQLRVIGITGTNGKTSCATLLAQALETLGQPCGVIGTLGTGFAGAWQKSRHTTPDAVALQGALKALRDRGAVCVCLEVSSHALAQGRVAGIQFEAAVFTNLSRDHLDYHNDYEAYGAAKASLFEQRGLRLAIVNCGDPFGARLAARIQVPTWTYDCPDAEVTAQAVAADTAGLAVTMATPQGELVVVSRLIGRLNAANLLAVATVLLALEHDRTAVAAAMTGLRPVPGRMELFSEGTAGPRVVVDYAHSPDALERALRSVREHCEGELWCVFGCGGDRDRGKRALMGAVAEAGADRIVLTDDNPRHEDPAHILADIVAGMAAPPTIIHDRRAAIAWAIDTAAAPDWVLVAGKGHETEQQVGDQLLPLDDRAVVGECLGLAA